MGRWAVAGARFAKLPINAGPKIFAARLGFVLCAVAALLYWLSPGSAVRVPLGILAGCAALEGLLGLCLGCHLYTWLLRLAPGPARPDPTSTTPMRGLG